MTTIFISDLANELKIDRSNLRKYVLSKGLTPIRVRNPKAGNQLMIALLLEDAEAVKEMRSSEGYAANPDAPERVIPPDWGHFYIVQLVPELDPKRIKLGFSSNIQSRFRSHRVSAPTAKLLGTWDCKRGWEQAAISSVTRDGCELISNETFTYDNVMELENRAEDFFAIMPEAVNKNE